MRSRVYRMLAVSLALSLCAFYSASRTLGAVIVTDSRFGAQSRNCDDPKVDDTGAFQKAIDAQSAQGGGLVQVPVGIYWFSGSLTLPNNVVLSGETPGPFDPAELVGGQNPSNTPTGAAVLVVRNISASEPFLKVEGYNACVQNLLFYYSNQVGPDALEPLPTGPTITIERGGSRVWGCSFTNSYVGIMVHQGRVQLQNLNVGAYMAGIVVDGPSDTVRIDTVTIHPFYELWKGRQWGETRSPIDKWVFENGYGVISRKADDLQLRDVVTFARYCGLKLEAGAQGATFGNASGLQFDSVKYGIIASATNPWGGFFVSDSYIDAWGPNNGWTSEYGILLIPSPSGSWKTRISFVGGSIFGAKFRRSVYVTPGSGTVRTTGAAGVPDGEY